LFLLFLLFQNFKKQGFAKVSIFPAPGKIPVSRQTEAYCTRNNHADKFTDVSMRSDAASGELSLVIGALERTVNQL